MTTLIIGLYIMEERYNRLAVRGVTNLAVISSVISSVISRANSSVTSSAILVVLGLFAFGPITSASAQEAPPQQAVEPQQSPEPIQWTFEENPPTQPSGVAGEQDANDIQAASISAQDGNSDYSIAVSWSASMNCFFGGNMAITLTATDRNNGNVEFSTSGNYDVGYLGSRSGTWTIYPGPSESFTFKITRRVTGTGCDNTETATNNGHTRSLKPPTNVTASANGSDSRVTLNWSRGTDITDNRGVIFYYIYKNGSFYTSTSGTARSYVATTTPSTTDTWGVATRFSGYTTTPARTSSAVNRDATTAAFKEPTGVVASNGTTIRSIDLAWSNPSDYASNTYIYRDGEQIGNVSAGTTTYNDTKVIPGDEYDYCVSNYRSGAETAQTCGDDPGRSFFVKADDGLDDRNIRVTWTLAPNELSSVDNVQILRNGQELDVKPRSSTTYTDILADPGVINRYDIVFRDAQANVVLTDYDHGFIPANGEINGAVTTEGISRGGVRDVLVSASPDGAAYKYALLLDGVDDYLAADHRTSLSLGQDYAIEMWLKPGEIRAQTLIAKGGSASTGAYGLEMTDTGAITFHARGGAASVTSSATLAVDTWTHIAAVQDERFNRIRLYVDGVLSGESPLAGDDLANFEALTIGADGNGSAPFSGLLDEIRLWNEARTDSAIATALDRIMPPGAPGLVSYWQFNFGEGTTVGDVAVAGGNHADLVGDPGWEQDQAPVQHAAVTDDLGQGEFRLVGLPYDPGTNGTLYEVTPTKENHAFDPGVRFERLTESQFIVNDANFTDTTSVTVAGSVVFAQTTCPVDSVSILVDGIPSGLTDEQGMYAVGGVERGERTISVAFREHTFTPMAETIVFTGDVPNLVFEDNTTRTVSGYVAGGQCLADIGRARVTFTTANGCFTQTIETSDNQYSIELPAQEYIVSVEMIDDPTISFVTKDVDLTDEDAVVDFIYYAQPEIVVSGFPEATCSNPLLAQGTMYEVLADVTERYGQTVCPATIGTVEIRDGISDDVAPFTVELDSTGTIRYDVLAGVPNIVGGGPTPYQKLLSIAASTPGGDELNEQFVIVEGHRPREQTFTTVSPQLPMLILRDPPGDQSYSFKEESRQTCYSAGFSLLADASVGVYNKIKAGTQFEVGAFGVSFETKVWGEISSSLEVGARVLNQTDREVCVTHVDRYSTSGNQNVTGTQGDVFVGAAMNIVYAITDVLSVDDSGEQCVVEIDQEIVYDNDGFATQYHYTENHIRNTVIPDLERNRELSSEDKERQEFDDQIEVWQQTLALNERLKAEAAPMGNDFNLSFSANAPRESFTEWQVTDREAIDFNLYVNAETAIEAGVEIGGVGASGGVRVRAKLDVGVSESSTTTTTNRTGFYLADDDTGDAFSVDVKRDRVYGTPVFELVSGVSSNPWEPGTLPRDGVDLTLSPATQTLPDAGATAEVTLSLGNTGQNFETREYELLFLQESNPFGAQVTIGGSQVQGPIPYSLNDSEARQVTLRLSRAASSPVYDYEDLQLVLRAPNDGQIADTASFSVHFASPCTPLSLAEPLAGWVVNQAAHDSLRLWVKDYQLGDLERIRFEVSPEGRNNWSPAMSVAAGDLPEGEAVLYWITDGVDDRAYDLRAVAECNIQGEPASTYSDKVAGVIDRAAPKPFGTPTPTNGILARGDDISATFNEPLSCSTATTGNVTLIDSQSGQSIPVTPSCNDKTIIVEPDVDLAQYENKTLQVTLRNIRDAVGNKIAAPISWSMRVNRSPVYWANAQVSAAVYEGEVAVLGARFANAGADAVTFSLTEFPDWLTPRTTRGTIQSGASQVIEFESDAALTRGVYEGTVIATSQEGAEPLTVQLDVSCPAPTWSVEPSAFSHSMSVTAGYYLDALPFSEEGDRVVALVGTEVRGVSTVQKVVPQDEYASYLTVYSNSASGEDVDFVLYDASECREREILESIPFVADGVVGSSSELAQLTVTGAVLQSIDLVQGWTWISFGVEATDMSADAVLGDLSAQEGDVIKSQLGYSQYVNGAGWVGTLDSLASGATYKVQAQDASRLRFVGEPIETADRPLEIKPGWNWVGFLPDNSMDIDVALASLTATAATTDIIKSQFAFANWDGSSWAGSLGRMLPGEGYLMRAANNGTLTYPGATGAPRGNPTRIMLSSSSAGSPPNWTVDAAGFEQSMTVTSSLLLDTGRATNPSSMLAAFVDGQVRGVARPVYVLNEWVFFLTVYGDATGEDIVFQAYDADQDRVVGIVETMTFEPEGAHGTPRETVVMTSSTATPIERDVEFPMETALGDNYPNPFMGTTTIPYTLHETADVLIELYDMLGRRVSMVVDQQQAAGRYSATVDLTGLAGGMYLYRMQVGSETFTRTMTAM